jgi:hypothetical protein
MEERSASAAAAAPRAGCFICSTLLPMVDRMWSQATNDHFRHSQIEFLKGVRSLIDLQIGRLSRNDSKGTRVTVE